jgi:chromosome segregation ATPase
MSDTTYSVKLDEKLKQKISGFVKESGITAKEFFAKLIEMYEMENQSEKISNHAREMKELDGHLSRIKAIYANLLEESKIEAEALRDEARRSLQEKEKEGESLKEENKSLKGNLNELKNTIKNLKAENSRLNEEISRLRSTDENKTALISEYKEKINNLNSSISKLKGLSQENEKVRKALKDMKNYVESLEKEKEDLKLKLENLQNTVSNLRKTHSAEIENLKSKAEFERESAVAREKQSCQEKIESLMDDYMKKNEEFSQTLRSLYSQIDELRDELALLKSGEKKNKKKG